MGGKGCENCGKLIGNEYLYCDLCEAYVFKNYEDFFLAFRFYFYKYTKWIRREKE